MRGTEFGELSAFMAVAEQRNFTRAAKQLGISPATLSETIRNLEERLGIRLLNRTTRSVAPTEAGEKLLLRLRPVIDDYEAAIDSLNEFRDNLLVTAFSSRGLDPKPAVPATIARSYANMIAVLLMIETAAAQRELGMAKKFAAHVNARMERVSGRLHTLRTELEQLVKETRS